jgi:hypothetical protein
VTAALPPPATSAAKPMPLAFTFEPLAPAEAVPCLGRAAPVPQQDPQRPSPPAAGAPARRQPLCPDSARESNRDDPQDALSQSPAGHGHRTAEIRRPPPATPLVDPIARSFFFRRVYLQTEGTSVRT